MIQFNMPWKFGFPLKESPYHLKCFQSRSKEICKYKKTTQHDTFEIYYMEKSHSLLSVFDVLAPGPELLRVIQILSILSKKQNDKFWM